MEQMPIPTEHPESLVDRLTRVYGPLIASRDLWRVLGYTSPDAYRQSRQRKEIPVQEFKLEGRRGYFADTADVARWITAQITAAKQFRSDHLGS